MDNILRFFSKHERRISILTLLGGFVFDTLTLRRADLLPENIVIISYLFLVALCLILLSFGKAGKVVGERSKKFFVDAHPWLLFVMQFAFGGLASAFLIFYSRSASIGSSWPFLLVFVIYMIANEILKKHYALLAVRVSAFFFALFSYFIFLFPIIFKQISVFMFVLAQLSSLLLACFLIYILFRISPSEVRKSKKIVLILLGSVLLLINSLYFLKLIPPVPLLLQEARMYNLVQKTSDGGYLVVGEKTRVFPFVRPPQNTNLVEGDPIYVFASIYSPTDINTSVIHKWEYYNEDLKEWQVLTTITIPIVGGREEGYRTFSTKSFVPEGKWRVDVALINGQTIGRVDFTVSYVDNRPKLVSEIK